MFIPLLVLGLGLYLLMVKTPKSADQGSRALEALKLRYVAGDSDEATYETMKNNL